MGPLKQLLSDNNDTDENVKRFISERVQGAVGQEAN